MSRLASGVLTLAAALATIGCSGAEPAAAQSAAAPYRPPHLPTIP
ncbi:hypothetical protein [Brevundimonas goettingensis]|nr:hypothetical protein [Brevundimonas goettingensis]